MKMDDESFAIPGAGGLRFFSGELERQEVSLPKKTASHRKQNVESLSGQFLEKIAIIMDNLSEAPIDVLYEALDRIDVRNLADEPTLEMQSDRSKIVEELKTRGESVPEQKRARVWGGSNQSVKLAQDIIDLWGSEVPSSDVLSGMLESNPHIAEQIEVLLKNRDSTTSMGVADIRAEEEILRLTRTMKAAQKKIAEVEDVKQVQDYLSKQGYTTEQLLEECLNKGYEAVASSIAKHLGISDMMVDQQAVLILAIKEVVKSEQGDEDVGNENIDDENIDDEATEEEDTKGLLGWNRATAGHLSVMAESKEELSPLHRFYQDRQAPVDPARILVEDAALKVKDAVLNLGSLIRLQEIQFQRLSNTRYAFNADHIDSGRVVFKLRFIIGSFPYRQATMFIASNIKRGKLASPLVFYDSSGRERLLTEKVVRAYYNIKEIAQIRRSRRPKVEIAFTDRTLLPATPSHSMFRNEQLYDM